MYKKTTTIISVTLLASMLCACGSKTDASSKNFSDALNKNFEQTGELCLGFNEWPVNLPKAQLSQKDNPTSNAGRMAALETLGFVHGEETAIDNVTFLGTHGKIQTQRYTLTEAAKPFLRSRQKASLGAANKNTTEYADLCWGKLAVDKIVKWEGPIKLGDYQEAPVTFTYKVENIADWAKNPNVQASFVSIGQVINGATSKELRRVLKLTSEGWETR